MSERVLLFQENAPFATRKVRNFYAIELGSGYTKETFKQTNASNAPMNLFALVSPYLHQEFESDCHPYRLENLKKWEVEKGISKAPDSVSCSGTSLTSLLGTLIR